MSWRSAWGNMKFKYSTFIEAPSSTKNKDKTRDTEAHSTKKGNTWHFGYKAHAIYLYDDHFDIVFNASNQMMEIKNIPIDDIEAAFNGCSDAVHRGSSIKDSAPPMGLQ